MYDIYKNIEEFNPNKKHKILIVFDDMIADMLSNKRLNLIVTELFIRSRKLNISIVFITQSYFVKCTAKTYYLLVINVTLASDNLLSFRRNLLEKI